MNRHHLRLNQDSSTGVAVSQLSRWKSFYQILHIVLRLSCIVSTHSHIWSEIHKHHMAILKSTSWIFVRNNNAPNEPAPTPKLLVNLFLLIDFLIWKFDAYDQEKWIKHLLVYEKLLYSSILFSSFFSVCAWWVVGSRSIRDDWVITSHIFRCLKLVFGIRWNTNMYPTECYYVNEFYRKRIWQG